MKKLRSLILCAVLVCAILLSALPLRAEAAGMSASFSGSSSLRAGDSVTVTFALRGASNLYSIRASLHYDSSLEFLSSSNLIGNGWSMDGTSTIMLEDPNQAAPFGGGSVFSVTFRVKSSVAAGTSVTATIDNISATDGQADYYAGAASWSATIAAPLSSNANLSSLSCGSGTLSPAFSASTTTYSVTVPYSVTSLSLNYSTQESGARVSVSGNSLSVGSNTVTVTVTAPNGNTKNYVIYATRQQDPNYRASSNANLSSLSVSAGTLSPAFSADVTDYVVYVPYETDHIDLSGVAQDGKARSVAGSSADLEPGDNELTVVCTAEDGATQATYTVHVYRMPEYQGTLPEITGGEPADYTAVDRVLARVPADLSGYTDESVQALQKAVDAVVRDYPAEKQADVDDMAKAIGDAIGALAEKPAPVDDPEPIVDPEPQPTVWDRLLAVGTESVSIPYVADLTGPLPLWIPAAVALGLLLLLFYLIGTLIGRAVGKRRTLRRLRKEQEAALKEGDVVPVAASVAGDETWELPAEAAAAVAETVDGEETPEAAPSEEPDAPEAPETELPAPEETVSQEPVTKTPAPAEAAPEEPVAEAPAPAEAVLEEPTAETPAPVEAIPEEPVAETPAPVEAIPEAPEAADPQPPAAADVGDKISHMSLDDMLDLDELLDDIRHME